MKNSVYTIFPMLMKIIEAEKFLKISFRPQTLSKEEPKDKNIAIFLKPTKRISYCLTNSACSNIKNIKPTFLKIKIMLLNIKKISLILSDFSKT
jgi:hypothetical protein